MYKILRDYSLNSVFRAPDDAAAAAATAAAAAAAAAAGAAKPWYGEGVDAEIVGHIQTKGWHDKAPNVVALEAIKSHREAEKFLGVPADRLVRLPADATDAAGWKSVWQRLGAPADAKDYDFSSVKLKDGKPAPEPVINMIREVAAAASLPKDAATRIADAVVKFNENSGIADSATKAALLAVEKDNLAKNWGTNAAANMVVAQRAAAGLGWTPEEVSALEGVVGYAKLMENFRSLGARMGEDKFVRSESNFNGGVMTAEQAVAEKATLMADTAWVKRYQEGGMNSAEFLKMNALNKIITGFA